MIEDRGVKTDWTPGFDSKSKQNMRAEAWTAAITPSSERTCYDGYRSWGLGYP